MDYYQTLGVNRNASQDEIKKAYRKLASKHHPDKGGDKQKFQEIEEAYRTLGDDQKRAEYDNPQIHINSSHFNQGFGGFGSGIHDDIFAQMFGGRAGPFNRQRVRRNKNVNIVVKMTLKEILTGKNVVGSIKLPSGRDQTIQITIPPGVETGDAIKYSGLGDNSIEGIPSGDLIVQIHEEPDPVFRREGSNIFIDQTISVFDAILGTKVKITTLESSVIELSIPAGTKIGTVFSCNGYGLPYKNSKKRGNLFIKINVSIPQNISDPDKLIIENLRKTYS